MRDAAGKEFEADFGMLAKPSRFSHTSSPHLIIGECKSFNRFEKRDFARAEEAANLFPGAILCFCTFNEALETEEIKGLTKLAKQGRKRMDVGKRINPVLILTGRELFSEFKMSNFYSLYGDKADYARGVYMRDDMQELCEFTQTAISWNALVSRMARGKAQEESGAAGCEISGYHYQLRRRTFARVSNPHLRILVRTLNASCKQAIALTT